MLDVYDIWLYTLQDWWRTVNEMSDPFFALCSLKDYTTMNVVGEGHCSGVFEQ